MLCGEYSVMLKGLICLAMLADCSSLIMDPSFRSANRFLARPYGSATQNAIISVRGGRAGQKLKLYALSDQHDRALDELDFVNRRYEAEIMAANMLDNQRRIVLRSTAKPILTTTGQLYGVGKSMMGRYATKCIDIYPEVKNHLEHHNAIKHSAKFGGQGLLDAYMSAQYIHVQLDFFFPSPFKEFWEALAFGLFCAFLAAVDPFEERNPRELFLVLNLRTLKDVVSYFQRKMPGQTFFLHFDEVGIIETDGLVNNNEWQPHGGDLILRLERYYDVWLRLFQLLTMEGVYVYATDKRPAFALIGLGLLSTKEKSPSMHRNVFLGAFGPDEIVQTFQNSRLSNGDQLIDHVRVDSDLLDEFGRQIYQCTAGVPRLICGALETLCRLQRDPLHLNSQSEIASALEQCYTKLVEDRQFWFSDLASNDFSDVYVGLMFLAMLKQSIGIDTKIQLPSLGKGLDILQLADRLDIFFQYATKPDGTPDQGKIVLKFSSWNLRYLTENSEVMDKRLPSISPLVPMAEILDYGAPLEWLLMMVLLSVFALASGRSGRTWSEVFPVFSDTCVANLQFFIDTTAPVSLIPGVTTKTSAFSDAEWRALKTAPSAAWSRQMLPEDWKKCFEYLIKPSSLIHPAPKSSSPDLLFTGMSNEESIIGWALKLTDKVNSVTWSLIQEEINKTSPLLVVKKVCLVITALHLGKEILQTLSVADSSTILLSQGAWRFSKSERTLVQTDDEKANLIVPDGLEVLILGPQAVEEIFGEPNVRQLEMLVKKRREPNWPSLLVNALSANNFQDILEN